MSSTTQVIVSALVRRDGKMLLVEEMEPCDSGPTWMLPGFLSREAPAGTTYVAERT